MAGFIDWLVESIRFASGGKATPKVKTKDDSDDEDDRKIREQIDSDTDARYYKLLNSVISNVKSVDLTKSPYYDKKYKLDPDNLDTPYWVDRKYEDL
jgi:hypothetical protein